MEVTVTKDHLLQNIIGRGGIQDQFITGYFAGALWASTEDDGTPIDTNYSIEDIDERSIGRMVADCYKFLESADDSEFDDYNQAGVDFWLTRNHHGSGYWDGDYPETGDALTQLAHSFGERCLYVSNGTVYEI